MDRVDEKGWTEREAPCGDLRDMLRGWNAAMKFGKSRAADALDSQPTEPYGWMLVPKEATDAMYFAACNAFHAWRYTTTEQPDFTHRDTYRAMLTAVPASSQPTDLPSETQMLIRMYSKHQEWAKRSGYAPMEWDEFKATRRENPLSADHLRRVSSQPTDGGVRNG